MRTFPKALATLRKIINERGEQLRRLTFEELGKPAAWPVEQITVESRPTTISIIVQLKPDDSLLVVVRGFMKARFMPGYNVAMDGFCKHPDGSVTPMPDEEFYKFD